MSDNNMITIVSGLPRSGTSMMMRMLEMGGIPPLIDNIRKADVDNPRGYYEFERVKKIKEDTEWLEDCKGKVVKMVSDLLFSLPTDRKYKVMFMRRNMSEMLASQKKMLDRLGNKGAGVSEDKMTELYEKHLKKIMDWLEKQDHIDVKYTWYHEILADPATQAVEINEFLNNVLDAEKMASAVDSSLYRNKK